MLVLLVVVGLPAAIGTAWLRGDLPDAVVDGPQPGGRVHGRVLDPQKHGLAGRRVESVLVEAGVERAGPDTVSDESGRFELVLPPLRGRYLLRAGGGEEQRAVRPLSFLGPRGVPLDPPALELVLRPGAVLELALQRPDGTPAGDGRWVLEGSFGKGLFFGCVPYGLRQEGRIEQGRVHADGLPPLRGTLTAILDSGETLTLELVLRAGLNARTIRL